MRKTIYRFVRKGVWISFGVYLSFFPMPSGAAEPTIPGFYGTPQGLVPPAAGALPKIQSIVQGVDSLEKIDENQLIIHQNRDKAIIEWQSFDIGANARTHFDQQGNTNWSALNRIYDRHPSQIFGRLTADGKIFLINQNGILFSPGARVNAYTLGASSLNMHNDDFLAGLLTFADENYQGAMPDYAGAGPVSNHGWIETDAYGAVFLLAPLVENAGTIVVPYGDVNIGGGEVVSYSETISTTGLVTKIFTVEMTGTVTNFENGGIMNDGGAIRLYGDTVENNGLIRSVTATRNNGVIELKAARNVVTGAGSLIATPITDSAEKLHESFVFQPGEVSIASGRRITLNGRIAAPSGTVSIKIEDGDADSSGNASPRIYVSDTGSIDVSGVWVDKNADEQIVGLQLNSVELRDDYGQKGGQLQGESVAFNQNEGAAIGNVEGHLSSEEISAAERATEGGDIAMDAATGDIIIRENARLDFSGGGFDYRTGTVETSKLVSENTVHDISGAPQYVRYDGLLGDFERLHERYGIVDTYSGLFAGGALPVKDLASHYQEGSDAGSLTLLAKNMVLDGGLDGSVTVGSYQTEQFERGDELGFTLTSGREIPRAGTLIIGNAPNIQFDNYKTSDPVTAEIVIAQETAPLPKDFGPESSLGDACDDPADNPFVTDYYDDGRPFYRTILSAEKLSDAVLKDVTLHTTTQLVTEADARLVLAPDGTFTGTGRRIVHQGALEAASGRVFLETASNLTTDETFGGNPNPDYIPLESLGPERIHLVSGSVIDAGGERIDNVAALYGGRPISPGTLDGGALLLYDWSNQGQGVILEEGAKIDVSGGFRIGTDGSVKGGDAGLVDIRGTAVVLDGELKGHSLAENTGGRLSLKAETVAVTAGDGGVLLPDGLSDLDPIPDGLLGSLTLEDDRLEGTGFTDIALISYSDLIVAPDAVFTPSNARLASPVSVLEDFSQFTGFHNLPVNYGYGTAVSRDLENTGVQFISDDYLNDSAVLLEAGSPLAVEYKEYAGVYTGTASQPEDVAKITISADAAVAAALGGTIAVEAPGITVAGTLTADSGRITLSKTASILEENFLHIADGAAISARGVNRIKRDSMSKNVPADGEAFDGGSVVIEADGLVVFDEGAVIDVSGAGITRRYAPGSDGRIRAVPLAGHAGDVTFIFDRAADEAGNFLLNGNILGDHADLEGIQGGALTLEKTLGNLSLAPAEIGHLTENHIDSLSLLSRTGIEFNGAYDIQLSGTAMLDAPVIQAVGESDVSLSAQWVVLQNTAAPSTGALDAGDAVLQVTGRQGIELNGIFSLGGLARTELITPGDLVVTELPYSSQNFASWKGGLKVKGDLTLSADRVYPSTQSRFFFHAMDPDNAVPGMISIQGEGLGSNAAIYSADGMLVFSASQIEQDGRVAAPLGDIVFCGDYVENIDDDGRTTYEWMPADRVFFSGQSTTATKGDSTVYYGLTLASDNLAWQAVDRYFENNLNKKVDVLSAPSGAITTVADEFISIPGAVLEASGGGAVYSYRFDPGIEGSVNPLEKLGRRVLLPDSPALKRGDGITVTRSGMIGSGEYVLLPPEYAFAEGAMVVEDRGPAPSLVLNDAVTDEGWQLVLGYHSDVGTDSRDADLHMFALIPAAEILKQGYFETKSMTAGNGGSISMASGTTILGAALNIAPLEDFAVGTLQAGGGRIEIGSEIADIGDDFGFGDILDDGLKNKLQINAAGLLADSQGILKLGDAGTTQTIDVAPGTNLSATDITLSAAERITLAAGAVIQATGESGGVSLVSPEGSVAIGDDAVVHAVDHASLSMTSLDLSGDILIDNSTLALAGDEIWFVPDGFSEQTDTRLYLTHSQWDALSVYESIEIGSRSGIVFYDDMDVAVADELIIDSGWISSDGVNEAGTVDIMASRISLKNTRSSSAAPATTRQGELTLAADDVVIGSGNVHLAGFDRMTVDAAGDIEFLGEGSLNADGDLHFIGAGVKTTIAADSSDADTFRQTNFSLTSIGELRLTDNGGAMPDNDAAGGRLSFIGNAVVIDGIIDAPAAEIFVASEGNNAGDSIVLTSRAGVSVEGAGDTPAGKILLSSGSGGILIEAGAGLSVAGKDRADAGTIAVSAAHGIADIQGDMNGSAENGTGAAFILDSQNIGDLSDIAGILWSGGFTDRIDIRSRPDGSGVSELYLPPGTTLIADHIKLTADSGDVTNSGILSTTGGAAAGAIALYAGDDLVLTAESLTSAASANPSGGQVFLGTVDGAIHVEPGAVIDVSGPVDGLGGRVYFRTQQNEGAPNIDLAGSVTGAEQVVAEIYDVFAGVGEVKSSNGQPAEEGVLFQEDISAALDGMLTGLVWDTEGLDIGDAHLSVIPGVEIVGGDELVISDEWTLTAERFGAASVPGALTVRSEGDLIIEKSIADRPTVFINLSDTATGGIGTWGIRLIAGADRQSADVMAVRIMDGGQDGNLAIQNGALVYSQSAPIWFSSANDTFIGTGRPVKYISNDIMQSSLMTYEQPILGHVGGSLEISSGSIQSATGDIELTVGGDLLLKRRLDQYGNNIMGSVRTIGRRSDPADYAQTVSKLELTTRYWDYRDGGEISLHVNGEITGTPNTVGWGARYLASALDGSGEVWYQWAANYGADSASPVTQGIAGMAGGDIEIYAGGDVYAPIGNFGSGDLAISTQGNLDGRFLVTAGTGRLVTLGDFGRRETVFTSPDGSVTRGDIDSQIELFASDVSVTAWGLLDMGSVLNPSIASLPFRSNWNLGYSQDTTVNLTAVYGDVQYAGASEFFEGESRFVMPPNVGLHAGRDVLLDASFYMPPAHQGQLVMTAGRDIDGGFVDATGRLISSTVLMSDIDPARVYGEHSFDLNDDGVPYDETYFYNELTSPFNHATAPVHAGDPEPVRITAGRDIKNIDLVLSKQAEAIAGRDITNYEFLGQTLSSDHFNMVYAGNDIRLESATTGGGKSGIESTGPGGLIVQAGRIIDLGATEGIRATGGARNPWLPGGESVMVIAAGAQQTLQTADVEFAFEVLRNAGIAYSEALSAGTPEEAERVIATARDEAMPVLMPGDKTGGDINMVKSQINTSGNAADVYIISSGDINIGKSALSSENGDKDTGIYTASGGSINIFSIGDLNVNESRIVSFGGGDIMAWTDTGNINAGRGSRTAINASAPRALIERDENTGEVISVVVVFDPPAVGSGIRALTFDPDGEEGPQEMPEPGDIQLFAPEGEIDAGEAGIAGKNIILAATRVLNIQNIEVTGTTVGVPEATPGASIGALAGAGTVTEAGKMSEESSAMKSADERLAESLSELSDSLVPKWIAVEVIGFAGNDEADDEDEENGSE